jgi:hypothetical protein
MKTLKHLFLTLSATAAFALASAPAHAAEWYVDAVNGDDELDFMMEPDEGFNADYSNGIPCSLTYDQYYDYFVRRKYDYPET